MSLPFKLQPPPMVEGIAAIVITKSLGPQPIKMLSFATTLAEIIMVIDAVSEMRPTNRTEQAVREEAYDKLVAIVGHEQADQFIVAVAL